MRISYLGGFFFGILMGQGGWELDSAEPTRATRSSARAVSSDPAVSVAISRDGSDVNVMFQGLLQAADVLSGPWTDLPNAVSPFHESPTNQHRFYRARDNGSIFSSETIARLTIMGPLQKHFELAFAGTPDGINPPHREKPYFDGNIHINGLEIEATLRVRGNSSLQECPFPKMKFKISKEERVGTPFFDAREVKIGTHCAEGGHGNIGRLRDERAAYREALAYQTMGLLGFISPRVRLAEIEYHDTTAPTDANNPQDVGWQISRKAVLLDDIEVVAERLGAGARALDDEEIEALTKLNFDPQLVVDLRFLHILLGNWDYALSLEEGGLRNTDVIQFADGQLVPVAGDFDLASWVTEVVRSSSPHDYRPDLGEVERQARYGLEEIRNQISQAQFASASNRFVVKQEIMKLQIAQLQIDEAGRTNALRHVSAFYDALAEIK